MTYPPLRIIHISDTHLLQNSNGELLGVKTSESFQAVVELVKEREKKIDLILLSGDLSQDGSEKSYQNLASMLKIFQVPIYYAPGNHDNLKQMEHVFPLENISNQHHILIQNWQIIMLNSHKNRCVEGHLDESQFQLLEKAFIDYPDYHTLIMLHHHPVKVGSKWLDQLNLENSDAFWNVLNKYQAKKIVLFGHVHQAHHEIKNGVPCYSAPSTCVQFKPKQNDFAIEKMPQGYRWVELYQDGHIKTEVVRLLNYIGDFNSECKGY